MKEYLKNECCPSLLDELLPSLVRTLVRTSSLANVGMGMVLANMGISLCQFQYIYAIHIRKMGISTVESGWKDIL